ncbi:MAG: aromatic ring-hydroxylating dioxygenase subunit alpha [Acidobacteria bacterium]|nr:MAG: aromatic ring-hydroxylating dioxygenase subunit alpha [Acidobacteriota bacterium]
MTSRPPLQQRSLPGALYGAPDRFAEEQQRIFRRRWVYVCNESDLPRVGSHVCLDLADDSVVVVRAEAGVRAFHNVCRHRGTRLCWSERGHQPKALVCPYHAWAFSFDGELIGAPNFDPESVPGFSRDDYALLPVAVAVVEGLVFVHLGDDPSAAPPVGKALPHLAERVRPWDPARLVAVERRSYEVPANWKLFFQNYSECYHCPSAHPALNRLTPYLDSSNDLDEGAMLGGPMRLRDGVASMSATGAACAAPLPGLDPDRRRGVWYYTVFPNLFLSLHPDYLLVHRIDALEQDRTRIECAWYFAPESATRDDFDPTPAVEFWDQTNRQDWELCRQAHRGVTSRAYVPGPYAAIESTVAAFDREYLRAMGLGMEDLGQDLGRGGARSPADEAAERS